MKNFTFYDVVLDFILMDAFDDLENPPSSVIAVINNRWLSNGFKETVSQNICNNFHLTLPLASNCKRQSGKTCTKYVPLPKVRGDILVSFLSNFIWL